ASDGSFPTAALLQASDGNFYGTAIDGGPSALGTIFRMTPSGVFTRLAHFSGTPDSPSGHPNSRLIQATDGFFYGTTAGGDFDYGTLYRTSPNGGNTIVDEFPVSNKVNVATS